nr:PH domain-containing protein [uncultured Oscillibacter sp.]
MGIFSGPPVCSVCGELCDFPKFKLGDGNWLCQDCLKDAGLGALSPLDKITAADITEMKRLHTASKKSAIDMYNYAINNGFGSGFNEKWGIKHFSIIQEHLLPEEQVLMTFIGLHNYKSASKHDGHFAYAITNQRFAMAQKQTVSGEIFQTVALENVNDITFKSGVLGGTVTIDTIKEVFNVYISKESAKKVHGKILSVLQDLKQKNLEQKAAPAVPVSPINSAADEILKFKNLLDQGIITKSEFEEMKKKLLDL